MATQPQRPQSPWRIVTALGLAAILFVSVNILAGKLATGERLDLTQQGLYTLSPGTKAILSRIKEPISLTFYYSEKLGESLTSYGVYAERVREMLQRYAALAPGKIELKIVDPVPFSEAEDRATAAGIQGVPLEEGGQQVYFGLDGTNTTDDHQTIPFFQPERERFLEYDLTKLVQQLAHPKQPVVGLVTTIPLAISPEPAQAGNPGAGAAPLVMQEIKKTFEVRDIGTDFDAVPKDVDLLMIVQPQHMSDKTEYAIDQWVLKGGHALVLVDPDSELARGQAPEGAAAAGPSSAEFDRLLNAWGVALVKDKVVGDRLDARKVNAGTGAEIVPAEYLPYISLTGDNLAHDDPATAQLGAVNLGTAGALEPVKGAGTQMAWLLRSSSDSELLPAAEVEAMPPDILGLLDRFKPTGEHYVVAARLTGKAKSAFPGGPPKGVEPLKGALKASVQPIDIVLVADTDLLDERFWADVQDFYGKQVVVPNASNANFIANALDTLAGTGELIGLRSRGSAIRPFDVVDRIQRQAEDRYRAKEKELESRLKETQTKLSDLAGKEMTAGDVKLSPHDQQAIDDFRKDIIHTRQQLRQVQAALGSDLTALKSWLVFLDVALVPILVALAAIGISVARAQRRRRSVARA